MLAKGPSGLASFRRQHLLVEFASLKHACPPGVYVSLTPGDSTLWPGVLFVRDGPYAPAILRFQISFPSAYPDLPPTVVFTTDIFHPLLTPLTTYTYTTGSSDSDPVSATDEERLPPGGFSLRHGFPYWFQRAKRSAVHSGASSRNVSGSQDSLDGSSPLVNGATDVEQNPSVLSASSRGGNSSVVRLPQMGMTVGRPKRTVTVVEILRYIRSAFTNNAVLDSLPLEAAGNPGAWHAWRAHRRRTGQLSPSSSYEEASDRDIRNGVTRQPGDWNWEGVWEDRVKRGIEASQSDAILYGNVGGRDDLIRFLDLDDNVVATIKEDLKETTKEVVA